MTRRRRAGNGRPDRPLLAIACVLLGAPPALFVLVLRHLNAHGSQPRPASP